MTGARLVLFTEDERNEAHTQFPSNRRPDAAAPDTSIPPPRWQDNAACLGMDREMFFAADVSKPKKVCSSCDVQEICLWFTMMMEHPGQRYGMFGGMTSVARQRLGQSIGQEQAATFYDEDVRVWRRSLGQEAA